MEDFEDLLREAIETNKILTAKLKAEERAHAATRAQLDELHPEFNEADVARLREKFPRAVLTAEKYILPSVLAPRCCWL